MTPADQPEGPSSRPGGGPSAGRDEPARQVATPDDARASEATDAAIEPEVDPHLLELLVCPLTRTILFYDRAAGELVSRAAGLAYPIRNGVPLMTADAARELTEADLAKSHLKR